jgi:hypothetical protein
VGVETFDPRPERRPGDRLAAGFLLVLLALGCAVLWIGIPVGGMWIASKLADTAAEHFVYALPVTLVLMVAFARALFWINRLYLRVTLASRAEPTEDEDEESDEQGWARGPLEPLLVGWLVLALITFAVWFFVFAENPPGQGAYF